MYPCQASSVLLVLLGTRRGAFLNEESEIRKTYQDQIEENLLEISELVRSLNWASPNLYRNASTTVPKRIKKRFTMMDFRDVRDEYTSQRAGPPLARPIMRRANEILEKWENESDKLNHSSPT